MKSDFPNDRIVHFTKRSNNYQPNVITHSKQTFSAQEKRLFSYIVNQINHQDIYYEGQNLVFVLPIIEVSKSIGYKDLKKVCETIMDKKIFIKNDKNEFDAILPFPRIKYNLDNCGNIEITMFSDIVPQFIKLGKEYTRYNLEIMLSLSSKYSQRIFEILRLNHGRKVYDFEVDINDFKEMINATLYKNYKDFRVNVLEVAQKELFDKAGISFEYSTNGKQRNIDIINFKIITWKELATDDVSQELANYRVATALTQYNGVRSILEEKYTFKKDKIEYIVNNQELREKFVSVNALIETGLVEIVKNRTSYMAACLGLISPKASKK
ncbi:MAG: replication initiation protein [Arcicella sp.]|jgi:plasmid replication initiation protein|nr:replication initiation protein [Arcicella sp.]